MSRAAGTVNLADVQGNILRGYRMPNARHIALTVRDGGGARFFLGTLVGGDEAAAPQVTTADHWGDRKPPYCLNVGITAPGLAALGVPASTVALFPLPFRAGAAARAAVVGDDGPSDPAGWELGGPANPPAHILLSLYTNEARAPHREAESARLRALAARCGLVEIWSRDADAFPHGKVHFGYRDGIGQPRVEGAPGKSLPDMQPAALPGDFLLGGGYANQYRGNYIGDVPPELGDNASYSAFRVMRQDVAAFEAFIALAARRSGMTPELVAAKLMGRWRNGVPLTLSPDRPEPASAPVPAHELDLFDFAPDDGHPHYYDDKEGVRCPVGSHIRRLNPRGAAVMGKPHTRRLMRRGIPYGPDYDPARPDDAERGLMGHFICGDLGMQYEFILGTWANADFSAAGIRGTRDAILGAHGPDGGTFIVRTDDARDPIVLDGVPRLVVTLGSLYTLIPGIAALRYLAGTRTAPVHAYA